MLRTRVRLGDCVTDEKWGLYDPQHKLVQQGTITQLQALRLQTLQAEYGEGRPNLVAPTMGGKQFWKDVLVQQGWRVQYNVLTETHRLLDANNKRQAWGSYEGCMVAFERHRLALQLRPQSTQAVVLLHGIAVAAPALTRSMRLRKAGYEVIAIDYPSTRARVMLSKSLRCWQISPVSSTSR